MLKTLWRFVSSIFKRRRPVGMIGGVVGSGYRRPVVGFPKLGQWICVRGNGDPFYVGGAYQMDKIEKLAKNDIVVMDGEMTNPIIMQVKQYVRNFNNKVEILAYLDAGHPFQCGIIQCPPASAHCGEWWWGQEAEPGGCSHANFAWARYTTLGSGDGLLYANETGEPFQAFAFPGGRLVTDFARAGVPVAMANLCADWALGSGMDGIFIDETSRGILWMTNPSGHTFDYARDGYGSLAAWDAGYLAGFDLFYTTLRTRLGKKKIFGNGGLTGAEGIANGWMRENWPFQGEGTGIDQYINDHALYVQPAQNWMLSPKDVPDGSPVNSTDIRKAKLILGVSTFENGVGCLTGGANFGDRDWVDIWLDEFSVKNGVAAIQDVTGKHWLGMRLTPAVVDSQSGVHFATFEHGLVASNMTGVGKTFKPPTAGYFRILGNVSQGNDGSAVSPTVGVFMGASTSVFLWKP